MFDPQQHPRDSRGRFARKGVSLVKRSSIPAEDKRDEVSARVPDNYDPDKVYADADAYMREVHPDVHAAGEVDPDFHRFVPREDDQRVCAVCGDDAGANDHLDPADPAHVWMDVEGLTAGQIGVLNALTDTAVRRFGIPSLAAAKLVSDWISGTDDMSAVLMDPRAADGMRAYVSDALTDRAENNGHPADCRACAAGEPMIHNYEPPQA